MSSSYIQGMIGLDPNAFTNVSTDRQWIYVIKRFTVLQGNLALKTEQIEDGATKLRGVVSSINRSYRGESSIDHYILAGSWGKDTAIQPPNDIDVFVVLPDEVFHRFNVRQGNVQSQLLQEVRTNLADTYPQTRMRGDGQVVVVGFNSVVVEVIPAFNAQGGGWIIADTNVGGSWKHVNPIAEIDALSATDAALNSNARKITKIMKQWRRHCNVPIKSFHIEQLVREALADMDWGKNSEFWFDWIVRDVFLYMYGRAGGGFYMPGGYNEWISLGDGWKSNVLTAYQRACKACDYERANLNLSAGAEWQKIFGGMIPEQVT